MENLDEVCNRLDEIFFDQLETLQDYVNLSLKNELEVKEGFHNLAKSRYVMGSNSVRATSLPGSDAPEFQSGVKVVRDEMEMRRLEMDEERSRAVERHFGILGTSSLRQARANFLASIKTALDRLNSLKHFQNGQEEFNALMKRKMELAQREA